MLTLITGVPGSGKTLYMLNHVKQRAEKEGRPVFYSGIANLTLPWQLFGGASSNPDRPQDTDASNWTDLPDGSIIVIDECQRVFRPRGTGSAVPEYVAALETHRHRGLDIVLVTQHPMLVDSNIRRLVGQHYHVVRRFGGQKAVVHEWSSCTEISKSAIAESVPHDFAYPKDAFLWYKSAEVHTHKRKIPVRVLFLWASPVIIVALVGLAVWRVSSLRDGQKAAIASSVQKGETSTGVIAGARQMVREMTDEQYSAQFRPRVEGLAYSAPVYDDVTKVARAPVPSACIASAEKCQCSSQDGTRLAVPDALCRSIVRDGYFVPFAVVASNSGAGTPSPSGPVPNASAAATTPLGAGASAPAAYTVRSDSGPPSASGAAGGSSGGAAAVPVGSAGAARGPVRVEGPPVVARPQVHKS